MSNVAKALHADPALRAVMAELFGSDDTTTIERVIRAPLGDLVSKATMVAAPKMAKRLIARPKPAPMPKMPTLAPKMAKPMAPVAPAVPSVAQATPAVLKSDDSDFTVECTFAKFDEDEKTVFGWASITEQDGVPVIDRQGDTIDATEMAKAAYEYVIKSRKGGHQHKRTDTDEPLHVSDMIESMVFTPEKIAKMGLPPDTPIGWWVGYKVNDDAIWKAVKDGEITGLSIHGKGKRTPVS